jgi:hypothetical protein
MKRDFIRLPVAVLLMTLTGCPPTPISLNCVLLSPTDLSDGAQWDHSWTWECNVPGPLPTYGTAPETPPAGQILAGWQDAFYPGAQPLPCNNAYQYVYRGHVRFDLSQFDAIADATLQYGAYQSENQNNGPAQNPPQGYATVLGMSTGQAQGNNGPYWWPYDNDVSLPPCNGNMFTPCTVDVSSQSNQWTHQQHYNYGFIFAGPKLNLDSSVPQDNNAQMTWYGGFALKVLYNPALNPRATGGPPCPPNQ